MHTSLFKLTILVNILLVTEYSVKREMIDKTCLPLSLNHKTSQTIPFNTRRKMICLYWSRVKFLTALPYQKREILIRKVKTKNILWSLTRTWLFIEVTSDQSHQTDFPPNRVKNPIQSFVKKLSTFGQPFRSPRQRWHKSVKS